MLEFFAQKIFPRLPTSRHYRCRYCLELGTAKEFMCIRCVKGNDALLMLSGGKDSCYLLLKYYYENDIKVLAVLIDNGFMGKHALSNAQKVCEYTNTKLLVLDESDFFKRHIRNALLTLSGKPCYYHIDGLDGKLTFDIVKQLANKLCIGNVICGLTKEQIANHIGKSEDGLFIEDNINFLCPLAKQSLSENLIKGYLLNGLNLKLDALSTNSELVVLMGILDIYNLGYSSFEEEFSTLIRNNRADRQYWVNMFDSLKWLVEKRLLDKKANKILSKFDLTLEQVLNK